MERIHKKTFNEFKLTLQDYEIEGGFGSVLEKGMRMYYLRGQDPFYGMKFRHRNKRRAYSEYLRRYNKM